MIRIRWSHLLACSGAAIALALVSPGCGGGGGGGAAGPTAPTIADVAGNWSGSYTLESATGCGCIGTVAQLIIGFTVGSETWISQSGSAIEGTLTSPWTAAMCEFEGTVGSESLTAEATGCTITETPGMECPNGNRRDLRWSSTTLQATVLGNDMNGTLLDTWDCFKTGSGEPQGSLTLQLRVEQMRG